MSFYEAKLSQKQKVGSPKRADQCERCKGLAGAIERKANKTEKNCVVGFPT